MARDPLEFVFDARDDNLADQVFACLTRAQDEGQAAAAALLALVWSSLTLGDAEGLARALGPLMAEHAESTGLLLRRVE